MDDRSKPVQAASSMGIRIDHCTELEHSENIAASEQAQSRGISAFHIRNISLAAIAVLSDRMRGLRREVVNVLAVAKIEHNRRHLPRAGWNACGNEVVDACASGATPAEIANAEIAKGRR